MWHFLCIAPHIIYYNNFKRNVREIGPNNENKIDYLFDNFYEHIYSELNELW